MTATIYELSPEGQWHKVRVIKDVDHKTFQDIEAYVEYYQSQVRVKYSRLATI
ncbi:hypothetical protein LCGC14_0845830 [marine sediment metagenome]|uniref:Uncharacterized protein n=1 Tax=marine sediment metagenome TaxID=412755 RepID=A0A0F9PX32_9ZZZZ